jgi:hypothetical protein
LKSALQVNPLFFVGIVIAPLMAWSFRNMRWGRGVRRVGGRGPFLAELEFQERLIERPFKDICNVRTFNALGHPRRIFR